MFEKIILCSSEGGPNFTVGELAEALLYYQKVHLIFDYTTLKDFVKHIGMEQLLALLSRPNISATYCEESLGTQTEKIGVSEAHSFAAITIVGDQNVGQLKSRKSRVEYILHQQNYNKRIAKRLADKFIERVPIRRFTSNDFLPGGVGNAAISDLHDPHFVHNAIRLIIEDLETTQPILDNFKFDILHTNKNFFVFTDINFNEINKKRCSKLNSKLERVSEAFLLNKILVARADAAIAAHYSGDISTSQISSRILRFRYTELMKRTGINTNELQQFREIVLSDSPSIREVIDSGERSFDEFLKLLDKSQQFREWIQDIHPDEKIVKAYLKEVTAENWFQKITPKAVRYILGLGAGTIHPPTGIVLSAFDSIFLEKIIGGWRPNHFIRNKLKPFLNTDEKCN
ncbi:hypothetical protein [Nitrosomonas marina]|uniref:Uncharacterized protein n=1 Tax=Nitrosomonas marina TaxID=917 RepID=A0A1H8FF52_9PROT|nr:hypothetical protein [Nitrosomonas marina]SEN30245.1 hypothetical protein SAMN05216325_1137 [Nitrosomonas marina]